MKIKPSLITDGVAFVGAIGWSVAAQFVPELNNILQWEPASVFALAAGTRFISEARTGFFVVTPKSSGK